MDLDRYVDRLRADLTAAAAAAGPESGQAAERLAVALDPAFRMSLMEALSDAAAEVSAELSRASVEVRLRGRDPEVVVHESDPDGTVGGVPTPPAAPTPPTPPVPPEAPDADLDADDVGPVARITVRVPEALKNRAEELAAAGSQSLNAWIVQAVRVATREPGRDRVRDHGVEGGVDIDLGSMRFSAHGPPGGASTKRFRGWSR